MPRKKAIDTAKLIKMIDRIGAKDKSTVRKTRAGIALKKAD